MLDSSIQVTGDRDLPRFSGILTDDALKFVANISRKFYADREKILQMRLERQEQFDRGMRPGSDPETENIRNSEWRTAAVPRDLWDRRVEITGPAGDTKMVINAFNSG